MPPRKESLPAADGESFEPAIRSKFRDAVVPILQHGSVLIRNDEGKVDALLTAHDLLAAYHIEAEPLILLEGIERSLRHLIASAARPDEMEKILSRPRVEKVMPVRKDKPLSTKELSLGEIQLCLQNSALARSLALGADMKVLDDELHSIRNIRNALFHFDPERLPHSPIGQLRSFREYIEGLLINWQGPILNPATTQSLPPRGARLAWGTSAQPVGLEGKPKGLKGLDLDLLDPLGGDTLLRGDLPQVSAYLTI